MRHAVDHLLLLLDALDDTVQLEMISASAEPGIKPLEALTEVFGMDNERGQQTRILKTSWRGIDET